MFLAFLILFVALISKVRWEKRAWKIYEGVIKKYIKFINQHQFHERDITWMCGPMCTFLTVKLNAQDLESFAWDQNSFTTGNRRGKGLTFGNNTSRNLRNSENFT